MNIGELIVYGAKFLKSHSPSPALDAEILLGNVLKKPKEYLYANQDAVLRPAKLFTNYKKILRRRKKGEPIAYLTNNKEFYGLNFYVDRTVLIPRPETEIIVDEALNTIKKENNKSYWTIADIGTGSGCIAIALAKIAKNKIKHIYAADVSDKILAVAKKNARIHNVYEKIKLLKGSILKSLENKKIDILIANLPYLEQKRAKNYFRYSPGLKYEPKNALFAKESGLYWYKILFKQIQYYKIKPRWVFLEINPTLAQTIKDWYVGSGAKVKIIKDLNGYARIIKINCD